MSVGYVGVSCEQLGILVAHVILESAQGPNPSFFLFWGTFIVLFDLGVCWDRGLDSDLDQGLTINNSIISTTFSLSSDLFYRI